MVTTLRSRSGHGKQRKGSNFRLEKLIAKVSTKFIKYESVKLLILISTRKRALAGALSFCSCHGRKGPQPSTTSATGERKGRDKEETTMERKTKEEKKGGDGLALPWLLAQDLPWQSCSNRTQARWKTVSATVGLCTR